MTLPIVLRIADVSHDGDSSIYELRYIGTRTGQHDLRKSLRRIDGQPVAGIDPILVTVTSTLTPSHDGELEDRAVAAVAMPWALSNDARGGLSPVWLVPTRAVCIHRAAVDVMHRPEARPVAKIADQPPLTLADQLRPMVDAAMAGRLSTHEQARLERILIAAFGASGSTWPTMPDLDDALAQMRRHGGAAAMLDKLDHWLHQPPHRRTTDVVDFLRPYRDHAPLESDRTDPASVDPALVKG